MDRCREMIHGQIDDRKIDRYYMRTEMDSSLGFFRSLILFLSLPCILLLN